MAPNPCDQVLGGTPELLEQILLELSCRDLLRVQRSSKALRNNIGASIRYVRHPAKIHVKSNCLLTMLRQWFFSIQQKLSFKKDPSRSEVNAINPFLRNIVSLDQRLYRFILVDNPAFHRNRPEGTDAKFTVAVTALSPEASDTSLMPSLLARMTRMRQPSWNKMLAYDSDYSFCILASNRHNARCDGSNCIDCCDYVKYLENANMEDVVFALEEVSSHWLKEVPPH